MTEIVKRCPKCDTFKALDDFNRDHRRRDGRRGMCRACESENNRRWREANKDHNRERQRAFRSANPDYNQIWRSKNPERVQASHDRNRAKNQARIRAYKKAHPEVVARANARRRALRYLAPGEGLTSWQWAIILAAFDHACAYCGSRDRLTIDHVEPLARGGAHDPLNVVPACSACNCRKNVRTVDEFIATKPCMEED